MSKFSPAMKTLIAETSRKIFGNRPSLNHRTGFKYLSRKPIGNMLANYYPDDGIRTFKKASKDFTTELEERRTDALGRLRRRGKGPPKKGEGKRAKKGK